MFGSHHTGFVAGLATAFALGCRETGVKIYHEPPSVTITSPSDGTNYYAGESIEFIALVQSTEGDDLTDITHEWMAGSDLICESAPVPADGQPSCVHAFTESGVQSVEITVTDTRLDRASATSTVTILDNEPPPRHHHLTEQSELFSVDDLIIFEAAVSDAEESPENLTVYVSSSIDGELDLSGTLGSSGEWTAGGYLTKRRALVDLLGRRQFWTVGSRHGFHRGLRTWSPIRHLSQHHAHTRLHHS